MSNHKEQLIQNSDELLRFLKARTHAYHKSNLFFRDFHYAIIAFAESKGQQVSYGDAEELAHRFVASLEKSGVLKLVKPGSWMLNFPEFLKQSSKPAPSPKPAMTPGGERQPSSGIASSTASVPATPASAQQIAQAQGS
jgi:hypothetical protein